MGGGQLGSGRGHRLCGSISPLLISRCTGPIDLMGDRTRAGSFMSMGNHGPAFSKGSAGKVCGGEKGKYGIKGSPSSCRSYLMKWTPSTHTLFHHPKVSSVLCNEMLLAKTLFWPYFPVITFILSPRTRCRRILGYSPGNLESGAQRKFGAVSWKPTENVKQYSPTIKRKVFSAGFYFTKIFFCSTFLGLIMKFTW